MPLLLCPNCNASMQNVSRSGVELDMCSQCRGVWLDRGELEKLMEGARQERAGQQEERGRFERDVGEFYRDPDDWKRRHPQDTARGGYRHDDDHHKKRKKGFDIFDIFD